MQIAITVDSKPKTMPDCELALRRGDEWNAIGNSA